MNTRDRKILMLVLAFMFVASAALLIDHLIQYDAGARDQQEARELVNAVIPEAPVPLTGLPSEAETVSHAEFLPETAAYVPADEIAAAYSGMDMTELRAVNPDVVGWIHIPGTEIDYPILQGKDNDYYLHHTWQHRENIVGSIFLDYRNAAGFSDFNSILYGHHMRDGSMFHDLLLYEDEDFLQENPYIYLVDDSGKCIRYRVFAVYETATQLTYTVDFSNEQIREAWAADCAARSNMDLGRQPGAEDKILTLSTCTGESYTSRWVVQAWAQR